MGHSDVKKFKLYPFVRFGDRKVWVERRDLDALIDRSKETFGA